MAALLLVPLAACAPRFTALMGASVPNATIERIYVATSRELPATGPAFGAKRVTSMTYFRADISIPPTHETGEIEWAKDNPDASQHFVVTETETYDGAAPLIRSAQRETSATETLVYIHGYNNTLSEAMYRLAQIQADFDVETPSVLFSWPSAGDARGYIYDRDSVLYSRDDLESVLKALTAARGEKVFLLAHSVGSQLTMEVLRQAALRGDKRLLSRISGVVLISPDIDPDVFRRQAKAIGKLPQPFLIFASRQDRALSLAGFLTGRKPRLGVIDGPDKVAGLEVQIIDFTNLSSESGLNHFIPVTSPGAVSVLKGMISKRGETGVWSNDYIVLPPQEPDH